MDCIREVLGGCYVGAFPPRQVVRKKERVEWSARVLPRRVLGGGMQKLFFEGKLLYGYLPRIISKMQKGMSWDSSCFKSESNRA